MSDYTKKIGRNTSTTAAECTGQQHKTCQPYTWDLLYQSTFLTRRWGGRRLWGLVAVLLKKDLQAAPLDCGAPRCVRSHQSLTISRCAKRAIA